MAITADVRLIFRISANGSRKNSNSHANGMPNSTRRWNSNVRTRAVKGAGIGFLFMALIPKQDGAGGFPGNEHRVAPGWPFTAAFHVRHGGLHTLAAGQLHVIGGDVAQVRDVLHRALAPVEFT